MRLINRLPFLLLVGAAFIFLAGCGKKADDAASASAGKGTSPATVSQMPPQARAMADEHTKGMEADAKKRQEAMKASGMGK